MIEAPTPQNEADRLAALHAYQLLDTEPEPTYDRITSLAAAGAETPTALISLIAADRQWFKSRVGLDVVETSRAVAFCAHTILQDAPLIVPDARADPRFANNPLVVGAPEIRSYAGFPLATSCGHNLGTLCVISPRPGAPAKGQQALLATLAAQIEVHFELRRIALNRATLSAVEVEHATLEIASAVAGISEAFAQLAPADLSPAQQSALQAGRHATDHLAFVLDDLTARIQGAVGPAPSPQHRQADIDLR